MANYSRFLATRFCSGKAADCFKWFFVLFFKNEYRTNRCYDPIFWQAITSVFRVKRSLHRC